MLKQINLSKLLVVFLGLVLFSSNVIAFMPETHTFISIEAINKAKTSYAGNIAYSYKDSFIACNMLSDISVFYYFSEGFNSIGTVYKSTHDTELCRRMIELAGGDSEKLACAYGVCAHQIQDNIAHNFIVPEKILSSKLPNGLIHILAEEKLNDIILNKQKSLNLKSVSNNALRSKASVHKEFFRQALTQTLSTRNINFDSMYDKFVDSVLSSSKYSVGFAGFTALPSNMHLFFILVFILNGISFVYISKLDNNSILFNIMRLSNIIIMLLIILLYILFFTNTLWLAFQEFSTPLTTFVSIPNSDGYINQAIDQTTRFLSTGSIHSTDVTDPSGEASIKSAESEVYKIRLIIEILIILFLIGLFFYEKNKRR